MQFPVIKMAFLQQKCFIKCHYTLKSPTICDQNAERLARKKKVEEIENEREMEKIRVWNWKAKEKD